MNMNLGIVSHLAHSVPMYLSLPLENVRKPYGFLTFSRGRERYIVNKWVNKEILNEKLHFFAQLVIRSASSSVATQS